MRLRVVIQDTNRKEAILTPVLELTPMLFCRNTMETKEWRDFRD